jgi:carbon-monoxide dehydrogenase medium subunit
MTLWQEYLRPKTVSEALNALATAPAPVLPLAGGTDLLLDLEQGRRAPVHTLVDITSVGEMLPIELRSGELFVGAAVPHDRIVDSPLVREHAQALVEGCALIGGPQVRNVATLGGNVAHALPAADGTVALIALDAQVEVAGPAGFRRLPLIDFFVGPGKNILGRNELLVGFYLPLRNGNEASAFQRVMRPQGVALPILNVAIWLAREGGRVADIRIAVGPAGPKPWRASAAEAALRGQALDDGLIPHGLDLILQDAQFRTSPHRSSSDYRRHLAGVLFGDTLASAWARAGQA